MLCLADAGLCGLPAHRGQSITVAIVCKPPGQVGFTVHPRRWAVQRFFVWISRKRRLLKDPEVTLASADTFLYSAAIMNFVRRLGRVS